MTEDALFAGIESTNRRGEHNRGSATVLKCALSSMVGDEVVYALCAQFALRNFRF
eukprot:IDg13036t1